MAIEQRDNVLAGMYRSQLDRLLAMEKPEDRDEAYRIYEKACRKELRDGQR